MKVEALRQAKKLRKLWKLNNSLKKAFCGNGLEEKKKFWTGPPEQFHGHNVTSVDEIKK